VGSTDQQGEEKDEGDEKWLMYRLEQHQPTTSGDSAAEAESRCAGRVEIFALDDSDGFEVLVAFEEGERASFWTTADLLQSATVRSGRQWRRKLQRQSSQQ
jgi:hypothetical protein